MKWSHMRKRKQHWGAKLSPELFLHFSTWKGAFAEEGGTGSTDGSGGLCGGDTPKPAPKGAFLREVLGGDVKQHL